LDSSKLKENLVYSIVEHMDSELKYPKTEGLKEIEALLTQYGCNPDTVTLDQLREIVGDLLQNTLLELKESESRDYSTRNSDHGKIN